MRQFSVKNNHSRLYGKIEPGVIVNDPSECMFGGSRMQI